MGSREPIGILELLRCDIVNSDRDITLTKKHRIIRQQEMIRVALSALDAYYEAKQNKGLIERTAQCIAHRACCGGEHDPANGKLHGFCVVCGVPWPCEYVGTKPNKTGD